MRAKDIIGNYCLLYGITMPECDLSQNHYFILIDSSEARVVSYQRSKLLGQVVCSAMKRGVVLHVHNGWIEPITWEGWGEFWSRYFVPQQRVNKKLTDPCRETLPKRSMFDEAKGERPRKKFRSRGFERTYLANINLDRIG